jgi:hypothetical protein
MKTTQEIKKDLRNDVVVIIRSVGERTLNLCRRIVQCQVDPTNIVVINEVPFSKAVRKTFEIGLDFKLPWTLAVDADVLLEKNAISTIISKAERELPNTFSFNVKSFDKFFVSPRYGGPHLYRSSLLEKALSCLPSEEFIRPETIVGEILHEKEGIENIIYECVLSIHDYEQWYRDIYRKAYVHANKHGNMYVESFLKYWSRMMNEDLDYKVALVGLCHGIATNRKINIDIRTLPMNYYENGLLKNIGEKKPLEKFELSSEDDVLQFVNSILYSCKNPRLSELNTFMRNTKPIRVVPGLIAYLVNKVSGRIYQWAKSPVHDEVTSL